MGNAIVTPEKENGALNGSRVVLLNDDWRNQTKNCSSYNVYKYVDFKGGGSLITSYIDGEIERTQFEIKNSSIDVNLLGENGGGEWINLSTITPTNLLDSTITNSRVVNIEGDDGVDGDDKKVLVCWDTTKRGAVGETPLHICFIVNQEVHQAVAKCLLTFYPALAHDIYITPEYYGESCVHIAIVNDNLELLKILVDQCGASIDQRARGNFFMPENQRRRLQNNMPIELDTTDYRGYAYYGEYPLAFAACFERKEMYDYLLEKGANVNAQDTYGNTVLHMMVIHRKLEMMSYVIKHTPTLNRAIENKAGLTPLTLATQLGYNDVFEKLLELESRTAWKYGDIHCIVYPLKELDSIGPNGKTNLNSCLALAVSGRSSGHLELINSGIIYRLLEEKWKSYVKGIFIRSLIATCFYIAFMSVAIYTRSDQDLLTIRGPQDYVRFVAEILTLISAIVYISFQINAVRSNGIRVYITSMAHVPTQTAFLLSCICFLLCIPGRFIPGGRGYEDIVVVLGVLLAWIGLLFYCRGITFLGPFVEMISRMLSGDIARFIVIYVIFLLTMTQAYYFLYKACRSAVFDNEFGTMMALFKMSVGHFPYHEFDNAAIPTLAKIFFVAFTILVAILLLNMLIAMMGSTYQQVSDRSEKEWRKQWAEIIIVLERSLSPSQLLAYQQSYCCDIGPSDNESGVNARGLMVIKRVRNKGIASKWKSNARAAVEKKKLWSEVTVIDKSTRLKLSLQASL